MTLPPHLWKCNGSLCIAVLHPRDVTFIVWHLKQMSQETHAKSSSNWKKLKARTERHFLVFSFAVEPGKGVKRVVAQSVGFIWSSSLSQPVLLHWIILIIQLFVGCFRFYGLITPIDVGNPEERAHGLSVIVSLILSLWSYKFWGTSAMSHAEQAALWP